MSLLLTLAAWNTVRDRPLSREYVEFMQRTDNLDPEERARQLATIRKFDYSGVWREPEIYGRFIGAVATVGFLVMAFRRKPNPQGGANGRQPFSSQTDRASAAAASVDRPKVRQQCAHEHPLP